MAIKRTYWCAFRGTVHRQDNLTGPWLDKSVPNQNITLNDIKSNPADGDKVYTVGTFNTIYYSSNAGDTWTAANVTALNPSTEWHEVWPIDINTIVAVGSLGSFGYSTDGGATWTAPSSFPNTGSLRAVHFLTPLIGVVGYEANVFKTTDGGITWTPLNSNLPLTSTVPGVIAQINGIHIDQTQQIIVVHGNTNIWRSTDGGSTFTVVYTYVHVVGSGSGNIFIAGGRHLTWYSDYELWGTGDFSEMVQSTNGGASWTLLRTSFPSLTPSATLAAHFHTTTDGFYSINEKLFVSSNGGTTGTQTDTLGNTDFQINAVWTSVPGPCYNLIACGGRPFPLLVSNDLSLLIGQVVMVDDACYTVQLAQSCQGSVLITTPITSFPDCCSCNPPTCYELRDCTGETPVIVTNTNLANYVGQTVKVCDFQAGLVLSINHTNVINCTVLPPTTLGFITQITGPTSGFFYEDTTGNILPYTNPSSFATVIGGGSCFLIGPGPTYTLQSAVGPFTYMVQFFIGTTAITNPIPVNSSMSQNFLQYLITLNSLDPNIVLTVGYFTFAGLNVQIAITGITTETTVTATITPDFNGQSSITEEITGGCICYTVVDIGPGCNCTAPFLGVISGVFPDCECCLPPPPPPEEPPYEPTIPEIDKHTYKICETQCDIDANKVFASAMYDVFKSKAYGVENCCPFNINLIWIRKELSDLSKIKC